MKVVIIAVLVSAFLLASVYSQASCGHHGCLTGLRCDRAVECNGCDHDLYCEHNGHLRGHCVCGADQSKKDIDGE